VKDFIDFTFKKALVPFKSEAQEMAFREAYIAKLPKSRQAAYKAHKTIRKNKQDHSPLDLQMTPLERVTRDVIKELKRVRV
jgi:hypothetical protein